MDKNVTMLIGVIYASIIAKPYITRSVSDIMNDAADQIGLILLITGVGGIGLSLPNDSGF